MGRLKFLVGIALLLGSCQSSPPGPVGGKGATEDLGPRRSVPGPGLAVVKTKSEESPPPVPALDWASWPEGWVDDGQGARVGLADRFWSTHRLEWRRALDPKTPGATSVRRLERIFKEPQDPDEAYRAAWHLWLIYGAAGLGDEARRWLDQVEALRSQPVTALDRAWDQAFRLKDRWGAQTLVRSLKGPWTPEDLRKLRLLRQYLFLGTKNLKDMGADDYVSTLALDRDDLWIGTWNGAVVRWSMTTDTYDLLLSPGATVAPVKTLAVTGWFVYVFQDQSFSRYSKVTGTWRTFSYPPGWTGLRVQGVVADGQESLWVAYLGQGLWHWQSGEWTLVDDGGGGPFLNALASDGAGGFLVGTKDRGLWFWKAGVWTLVPVDGVPPDNISVVEMAPEGGSWAVGTWGQGAWLLSGGRLRPVATGHEYVVAVDWDRGEPVWGTLDEGLFQRMGGEWSALGPLDGLPSGGVSALAVWEGRWIWGTAGQGLGWWSEHEDPALFR